MIRRGVYSKKLGGNNILVGTIDYSTAIVTLDVYDGGANTLVVHSMAGRLGSQYVTELTFRTQGKPLRVGSFAIRGVTAKGERFSVVSKFDGTIHGAHIHGAVDIETGVVAVGFGSLVDDSAAYVGEEWYDSEQVRPDGKIWKPEPVYADSIAYDCVIYSYIPMDAKILGVNPVRLPSDGRVPIVKPGNTVVIHNTQNDELPGTLTAEQTIQLSRSPVSSVELYDSSEVPQRVPSSMYSLDAENGRITIDKNNHDFSSYTSPLICMHKIEDMRVVTDTQINGVVSVDIPLSHDYPKDGTYISSALLFGDLQARYYGMFDQKTWKNVFSDSIDGDPATGTYNEIDYPIVVTNRGAVKERWAIVFDSQDHFRCIGEKYGVVGEGYTNQDFSPVNAATREPFFTILSDGWGLGWAASNVLRFNTEGAAPDFWVCRTTAKSEPHDATDWYTIQDRGDAE